MKKLKTHNVILKSILKKNSIKLRPLKEKDWDLLLKWNNDPEVLYYCEEDDIESRDIEEVKDIYCDVSRKGGLCFMIEYNSKPIGECWLQRMNISRIIKKYPKLDCRRIDLIIGEKEYWGKGIGTIVIKMLTEYGFIKEKVDMIFGLVSDYNVRSIKAFKSSGYKILSKTKLKKGGKAKYKLDVALKKEEFFKNKK